jgi:hypothetical protein
MGPFDFYHNLGGGEEMDLTATAGGEPKTMNDRFDRRKSGAMFRGEINPASGKPDGKGIKVFPNGSIYEGYFTEGQCHGMGRGVTSKGEVFQGQFSYDQMDGYGYF